VGSEADPRMRCLVMFQLCDHDQDGCMNPVHILQMLQRLERVFVRETARVDV